MKRILLLTQIVAVALGLGACQTAGSFKDITGSLSYNSGVTRIADHMPVGARALSPFGYVAFCQRHQDECGGTFEMLSNTPLTPERWAELNKVNEFVNSSVNQVSDQDNYNLAEWWDYPDDRGGDCEDFALLKRQLLIEKGWPRDALVLATARDQRGEGHAVLIVITDKGDLVLDNKYWAIVGWRDAPYTWIKRQSREKPAIWVKYDPAGAPETSSPRLAAAEPARLDPGLRSSLLTASLD